MAARSMTPSEKLVGRRLPKDPSYLDLILAGFVKEDGSFCGQFKPIESYYSAAHLKARRSGYIRAGISIGFGSGGSSSIWYLTPKGEEAARAAHARVDFIRKERALWAEECRDIHRAAAAKRAEEQSAVAAE